VKGKPYTVKRTMVPKNCGWSCRLTGHPNVCDVAIVELFKDIHDVKPYKIYDPKRFGSELHKNIEIYGWGVPGTASKDDTKICEKGALDRKFRKGMNTILSLGDSESMYGRHTNHVLKFMMRGGSNPKMCKEYPFSKFAGLSRCDPSGDRTIPYSQPLRLEAITSSGDSGTPAFIRVKGELYLAGIDSSGDSSGETNLNVCGYGALDEFTRVAKFSRFIGCVLRGNKCQESRTMPIRAPGMNFAPNWHTNYKHSLKKKNSGSMQCRSAMMNFWWQEQNDMAASLCNAPGAVAPGMVQQAKRIYAKVQNAKKNGTDLSSVVFDLRANHVPYWEGAGSKGFPANGDPVGMKLKNGKKQHHKTTKKKLDKQQKKKRKKEQRKKKKKKGQEHRGPVHDHAKKHGKKKHGMHTFHMHSKKSHRKKGHKKKHSWVHTFSLRNDGDGDDDGDGDGDEEKPVMHSTKGVLQSTMAKVN